jgi:hypothetical protein
MATAAFFGEVGLGLQNMLSRAVLHTWQFFFIFVVTNVGNSIVAYL